MNTFELSVYTQRKKRSLLSREKYRQTRKKKIDRERERERERECVCVCESHAKRVLRFEEIAASLLAKNWGILNNIDIDSSK